jgi:hypothetical protein
VEPHLLAILVALEIMVIIHNLLRLPLLLVVVRVQDLALTAQMVAQAVALVGEMECEAAVLLHHQDKAIMPLQAM